MFGFSGAIDVASFAKAGTPTSKQFLNAGGMFVILDVTGKTAQFDLLFRLMTGSVSKDVAHTHSDFSGVGIEKFAGPNNTSLVARVGNYFVWSNQEKVIQDLISQLGSINVRQFFGTDSELSALQGKSGSRFNIGSLFSHSGPDQGFDSGDCSI